MPFTNKEKFKQVVWQRIYKKINVDSLLDYNIRYVFHFSYHEEKPKYIVIWRTCHVVTVYSVQQKV